MRKTDSKLQFSKSQKFVFSSVFGELQLAQISWNLKISCWRWKIRDLGVKLWVAYFNFDRNYDILKSKSPWCILFNKNINFNKIETESEMENPIQTSPIKIKTVMSWSSLKKNEGIFCTVYSVRRKKILTCVFYLNV